MKADWLAAVSVSVVLVFVGGAAQAEEKKITRAELPPAVEKTVAEQSKGATLRGFAKETEGGKTFYEAELVVNGHGRDVLVDESGAVVEVEEEVAFEALPPAVRAGLTKAAGAGHVVKVESLTNVGTLTAYEAVIKTGAKRSTVQVGPDGAKLSVEE